MRLPVILLALAACGGSSKPPPEMPQEERLPPISVEWKVEQGEGNTVDVSLVVDGKPHALGALEAATEHEAGTPATCALRAASTRRTEIVCGDRDAYAAELVGPELVVSLIAQQRSVVKRIPVASDSLAVKMLVLPGSKL
jgi:hypothetical protein